MSRLHMVEHTCQLVERLFSVSADWDTFFQCHYQQPFS
jgi:hypothetical protein